MFPLSAVVFPLAELPLHVFEMRYRSMMADCLGGDGEFGVVLITRGSEVGGGDERVDVGTLARVDTVVELDDGRMVVSARGVRRLRVDRWLLDDPYPRAEVVDVPPDPVSGAAAAVAAAGSAVRRLRSLLSELGELPALPGDLGLVGDDEEIGWRLCELAPLNAFDRQQLLASTGLGVRMDLLSALCAAMADDVVALLAGGLDG
jgi:hypothetical protein